MSHRLDESANVIAPVGERPGERVDRVGSDGVERDDDADGVGLLEDFQQVLDRSEQLSARAVADLVVAGEADHGVSEFAVGLIVASQVHRVVIGADDHDPPLQPTLRDGAERRCSVLPGAR